MTIRNGMRVPLLLCLGVLLGAGPPRASAQQVDRAALEAAYVMNFLNYSDWPKQGTSAAVEEVTVLVLGPPTVVRTFRATALAARQRATRQVRVRGLDPSRLADPRQVARRLEDVQAVFVATDDAALVEAVIESTRGRPVLTIGEGREFVQRGGMLAFLREGSNLVFTSNVQAVIDSPVTLSSKVLRLAREPTGMPAEGARSMPMDEAFALLLGP